MRLEWDGTGKRHVDKIELTSLVTPFPPTMATTTMAESSARNSVCLRSSAHQLVSCEIALSAAFLEICYGLATASVLYPATLVRSIPTSTS
jgi:hypothetical protein